MTDRDSLTDAEAREWLANVTLKKPVVGNRAVIARLARALLGDRERIAELEEGLDKERALGDALAMVVKREKRQVYDRVQATAVPHALHGCCCPWCHITRLLDLYAEARNA